MKPFFIFFLLFVSICCTGQEKNVLQKDTLTASRVLEEVTVHAFQSGLRWKETPAAIARIGSVEMNRYGNQSLVPVFNSIPGIRMEERSPSSYRLSIRGSLLRSPFGIRNVKIYWDEIPLTDAGGNTYLNLADMNMISSAELLKGPAASMYGAGTGGALLLHTALSFTDSATNRFVTGIGGGSYGLFQQQSGWQYSSNHFASVLQQTHQQADGYREQSASRKDVVKWQMQWQQKKTLWQVLMFYTDLFYETPGGITLAQMQQNPQLSRQAAGTLPGAVQQKTAVYNKTLFGAIRNEIYLSPSFRWESFFSANHTLFTNPFITNYEIRGEANYAAGTSVIFEKKKKNLAVQWSTGAEWLYNRSLISDFGNRSGKADTVQFKDDIHATQWFAFTQVQLNWAKHWVLTAGLSLNNQTFHYRRTTDPLSIFTHKKITAVLTPRIAITYRLTPDISLYSLLAKGFSPPALAEVRPSDGNYYGNLEAEYGWNFETGIKGELAQKRIRFDIAAYFFHLTNAIVRRTNTSGAEYFVNAGGTKQNGIEGYLSYDILKNSAKIPGGLRIWTSYSYQPYRFTDYQQSGINYSGNQLTGVPVHIWITGMDIEPGKHLYGNLSLNCTGALPLTDANDVYADAYQLLQAKLGYRGGREERSWDIFAGIDNLLNQRYSLGNDINAAGKRYYNPAAGINFYTGMIYRF